MELAWLEFLRTVPVLILLVILVLALAGLSFFADRLVDLVMQLARRLAISPLLIGATVVSLGTTAPEASVSVVAALNGAGNLALGNGVGSIIVDTGLIMGLVLLLGRAPQESRTLSRANSWREFAVFSLFALLMMAAFFWPRALLFPRLFGLLLVLALLGYLTSCVLYARSADRSEDDTPSSGFNVWAGLGWLLLSLVMVVGFSRVLVDVAVELSQRWRVPQSIIAVSLVAFGTSVPELSTAIAALRRGETELALGNVLGADVLNAFFVVGVSATAMPLAFDRYFLSLHLPVLLLLTAPFRLFFLWARRSRAAWKIYGLYLLAIYFIYLVLIVMNPESF